MDVLSGMKPPLPGPLLQFLEERGTATVGLVDRDWGRCFGRATSAGQQLKLNLKENHMPDLLLSSRWRQGLGRGGGIAYWERFPRKGGAEPGHGPGEAARPYQVGMAGSAVPDVHVFPHGEVAV